MAALESKNPMRMEEAMEAARIAYANLLDIDGSTLSDPFLMATENLDLMKQAINGNVDAYNQLQDAMVTDYLTVGLHLDPDTAGQITSEYRDLLNSCNFDSIPVHAEIDNAQLLAGLDQIINACAATAAEAEALLSRMGIDATVVEDKTRTRDKVEATG